MAGFQVITEAHMREEGEGVSARRPSATHSVHSVCNRIWSSLRTYGTKETSPSRLSLNLAQNPPEQ